MSELPNYNLKRNARSKHVRLRIMPDGRLCVTAPKRVGIRTIDSFILSRSGWIREKLDEQAKNPKVQPFSNTDDLNTHRKNAKRLAEELLHEANQIYGLHWNNVTIRNQRTRWGSCSSRGNLSFNYKIVFLPRHLAKYIAIHELCHIAELNHGQGFWNLVGRGMPDYKNAIKELKGYKL